MADGPVEQLLLKFGINLDPAKAAGAQLKSIFEELNKISTDTLAKTVAGTAGQKAQLDQLKLAAQAAAAVAKQAIAEENVKAAVLKNQTAELQKHATERRAELETVKLATAEEQRKRAALAAETAEAVKLTQERKAETAEIQRQIAELRRKKAEEGGAGERTGGAIPGGLRYGIGRAIFGQGLAGGVAAGVLAGGGVALLLESAAHAAEHFVEKIKEIVSESGKLALVQDQFEKLARGAGVDPAEALGKLTEKTEGLVSKLELLKLANTALKSPFGVTIQQVEQMSGDVVKLSEASGHTAQEGLNGLTRFLQTGRAMSLAAATGLSRFQLQVSNLPPGLTRLQRGLLEVNHAMETLHTQAERAGDLPQTFEQMSNRLHIAWTNVLESFGKGVNQSTGSQIFLNLIKGDAEALDKLSKKAEEVGNRIGYVFTALEPIIGVVTDAVKGQARAYDAIGEALARIGGPGTGAISGIQLIGETFIMLGREVDFVNTLLISIIKTLGVLAAPFADFAENIYKLGVGDYKGAAEAAKRIWTDLTSSGAKTIQAAWYQDWKDFGERSVKELADFDAKMLNAQTRAFLAERNKNKKIDPNKPPGEELTFADKRRIEQIRLQDQLAADKAELQMREKHAKELLVLQQTQLQTEKQQNEEAYRSGNKSLQDYLNEQKRITAEGIGARITQAGIDYIAKVDEADATLRDKLADIRGRVKEQTLKPAIAKEEEKSAEDAHNRALAAAAQDYQDQRATIIKSGNAQVYADQVKANKQLFDAESELLQKQLGLLKEDVSARQKLNERRFRGGDIGAETYLKTQHDLIIEEAEDEIATAYKVLQTKKQYEQDSIVAEQDFREKTSLIIKTAVDKDNLNQESAAEERLQSIQKFYSAQQKALEDQITYQQSQEGRQTFKTPTTELLQTLQENLRQQRADLEVLIGTVDVGTEQWFKYLNAIEETYKGEVKANEELRKMKDLLPAIGGLLGEVGQGIAGIFHSSFAQDIAKILGEVDKVFQKTHERFDIIKGRTGPPKDPAMQRLEDEATRYTKALGTGIDGLHDPLNTFKKDIGDTADVLEDLLKRLAGGGTGSTPYAEGGIPEGGGLAGKTANADRGVGLEGAVAAGVISANKQPPAATGPIGGLLTDLKGIFKGQLPDQQGTGKLIKEVGAAIGTVADFISTVKNSKSAGAGALGGGLQGAAIGNELGGPAGGLIGAAIGASLGAIFGAQNAAIQRFINAMSAALTNIQLQLQQFPNNIGDAIKQAQAILDQIPTSSKYKELRTQAIQTVDQLLVQDEQIHREMYQQLAILDDQNVQQQAQLSTVQQLVLQYYKYAGAAQNQYDLDMADKILKEGLFKLQSDMADTLRQDNEQAINDALQLNDLLYQRQQLILNTNTQIESVLSQGVLVRQATRAQTAGQELQRVQYEANRQLDVLNEQIAAARYRVSAEGQIFNLANTRVGLEMQLLALQNQQTNVDIKRIDGLREILIRTQAALGAGNATEMLAALGAGMTALSDVIAEAGAGFKFAPGVGGTPPLPGRPQPPAPGPPGRGPGNRPQGYTDLLDILISGAYQDRATMGYAGFRAQNL